MFKDFKAVIFSITFSIFRSTSKVSCFCRSCLVGIVNSLILYILINVGEVVDSLNEYLVFYPKVYSLQDIKISKAYCKSQCLYNKISMGSPTLHRRGVPKY